MGRVLYWVKRILLWPFRPITRLLRDWLAGFIHTYFYDALDHAKRLNQLLESAPAQIDARVRTVEDLIRTSDQLMLNVLRALPAPTEGRFQVTSLGNGWLLAPHPHAGFLYLDATDVQTTPRIVAGNFEPGTTAALLRHLTPTTHLCDLSPHQGYHVLSAARIIGVSGSIVVLADRTNDVLHRNLRTHHLTNIADVTTVPASATLLHVDLGSTVPDGWQSHPARLIVGWTRALAPDMETHIMEQLTAMGRSMSFYRDGDFHAWPNNPIPADADHITFVVDPII